MIKKLITLIFWDFTTVFLYSYLIIVPLLNRNYEFNLWQALTAAIIFSGFRIVLFGISAKIDPDEKENWLDHDIKTVRSLNPIYWAMLLLDAFFDILADNI